MLAAHSASIVGPAFGSQPDRVSVLVHLERGAGRNLVRQFAAQQGGVVKYEYRILPDVVNLRGIPEQALRALEATPGVLRWEEDRRVEAFLNGSTPLVRALQSQITGAGLSADGAGIRVCVIDSGIDSDHTMYADRIDFSAGRDFVNDDDDPEDDFGHGAHVAGIAVGGTGLFRDFGCGTAEPVQGIAPLATLIGVKVLGSDGVGFTSDVIAGIDYCADQSPAGGRADVVNLSLGGGAFEGTCDGAPGAEDADAANAAVDAGVVVVAASGNSALPNMMASPACGSKVIGVGATYDDDFPNCEFPTLDVFEFAACTDTAPVVDQACCFSDRSSALDVVAPGCVTFSADYSSPDAFEPNCGTSMAAPHVAGLAALLLSIDPERSPAQLRQVIRNGAVDLGPTGFDNVYGYGRIDAIDSLAQVAQPCLADEDCDDGLFCTLNDLCIDGICYRQDDPCPDQVCDEDTDACVACLADSDCNDGDYCTQDSCVDTVCDHQLLPYCPDSYIVTDVGAVSDRNTPWSLNQRGEVVGSTWFYADYSGEGFISSCGQVKYIGTPQGASSSVLYSLNDYGKAAGTLALDDPMPIFWNGRNVKQLDIESVGGATGGAESINAFEEIVGYLALEGVYGTEAYVWKSGTVSILPNLEGQFTHAQWINDSGQIVGDANLPSGSTAGVVWEQGRIRRLPPFDDQWTHQPAYIHGNGDIVGTTRWVNQYGLTARAAIWHQGQHRVLGTLADGTPAEAFATSHARGINADGVVVGMSTNALQENVPFIWIGGEMLQLDDLMPEPWEAIRLGDGSINDAGQIAIWGTRPGDTMSRALLLTPTLRAEQRTANAQAPPGRNPNHEEWNLTCDDGVDNDGDTLTDCEDSDCMGDPTCGGCVLEDPGEPVPCVRPTTEVLNLVLHGSSMTTLAWDAVPVAEWYDVSRGLLSELATGGYGVCMAEDLPTPSTSDSASPPVADGFFYLVRAVDIDCGGNGTLGVDSQGNERFNEDPDACF
jgi:probable HAF family extracellular repeat protein